MTNEQLQAWLNLYKRAWETQDPDLFVTLFTKDCEYHDTPFTEPVPARDFHAFWRAVAKTQRDNHIDFKIVAIVPGGPAIVNWHATTTKRNTEERREGDGIFLLTFEDERSCSDLREWQHWHPVGKPLEKRTLE